MTGDGDAWDLPPREAVALQRRLAGQVVRSGRPVVRRVAGVDAAFAEGGRICLGAAVVWDLEEKVVLERQWAARPVTFPYVPGLLSFREAPALLAALGRLRERPDGLLCDGQGVAHPRRFGLACHLGVLLQCPSVGCAKSRLCGTAEEPGPLRGAQTDLTGGGEVLGRVVRTRDRVRPVYVSVGHGMTLDHAVGIVLAAGTGTRLPEPIRLADRWVGEQRRAWPQSA